jgi:hypothetical protein
MAADTKSPVELVGDMSVAVHNALHWVHLVGSVQGAQAVRDAMDALIPAAQDLRGRADAILTCDTAVEETAVFDEVMSHLDGGERR